MSGPQQVQTHYDSLGDLDGFAWDWGGTHEGQCLDFHRLVGFCLLIKREVIETIGLLDEQFGIGCFEDDDYCLRAIRAGFRTVIALDAFVHHFGGRTFIGSGADTGEILRENSERFRAKWERHAVGSSPETTEPQELSTRTEPQSNLSIGAGTEGGLRLSRHDRRPRLSLCMIVRDNERTLPACLESIRPWVDEMVIVDTGSVDDTPRIVESFGGRLFHFPWCDDFSAAGTSRCGMRAATGSSGWIPMTRFRWNAVAGCVPWPIAMSRRMFWDSRCRFTAPATAMTASPISTSRWSTM